MAEQLMIDVRGPFQEQGWQFRDARSEAERGLDSFDGRQVGDSQWIPSLFIRIVVELNSTKYGDLTLQSPVYTIVLVQAICGLFRSVN